jgi:CBS domain-containing protein
MLRKIIPDVVSNQVLVTLSPSATVRQAAQKMAARDVRSVLVTTRGKLEGIFTGTDLIKRVVARGLDPDQTRLREVMTARPDSIDPDANALEALRKMHTGRYRHLPVVAKGKLCGIVSRRDILGFEADAVETEEQLWERI